MDVPESVSALRMAFLVVGVLLVFFGFRIGNPQHSKRPGKQWAIDVGLPVVWLGVTIFTVGNVFALATAIIWGGVFALVSTLVAIAVNVFILWAVLRYAKRLRSGALDWVFQTRR
jgi:hypothetical protein